MGYKRQYHLMEWLDDERRAALGPDNLLLLRNAFVQFSNAFDEVVGSPANALPLSYIVSKIYLHFKIPGGPEPSYSANTLTYYDTIWDVVISALDW